MRYFFIVFSLLLGLPSVAQLSTAEHYNSIDNKIFVLSKKENLSIDSVVSFVNSNFTTPEDKVRGYYTFTSLYIAYDVQRLDELLIISNMESFDGPLHHTISQKPEDVFKNRKGVCEGISRLMVRFCESSGIPSQMIVGYCKTPDGEFVKDIGHAWNVVKLDSAWNYWTLPGHPVIWITTASLYDAYPANSF